MRTHTIIKTGKVCREMVRNEPKDGRCPCKVDHATQVFHYVSLYWMVC